MATEQDTHRSVPDADLQKCYEAFTRRRLLRGERSIRTPEGFQRLHKRYQRTSNIVAENSKSVSDPATPKDEEAEDSGCLRSVLNVFFNQKILRVITETCWRLANFGGGTLNDHRDCAGLELAVEKYSTFSLRLIQWVIPELPRRQVQELVQYDWELDRKFDELGRDGLSLQGFKLSLLDLLISCTDGTVAKSLEFLNLMARWLQHSLPPYIIQDTTPQVAQYTAANSGLKQPPKAAFVWSPVPFSVITPCQIGEQGLYCELKTKVCSAPIVIMILAANENPIELVLATSSKRLLRIRSDVNNKVALNNASCWTFCISSKTPSILLVPGSTVSRQTKALYACFCTPRYDNHRLDSRVEEGKSDGSNKILQPTVEAIQEQFEAQNAVSPAAKVSSGITLFTSVPEQISLRFESKSSVYYRMERMSTRTFIVERSAQLGEEFTIKLTGAHFQSNNSAGEPPVLSTVETNSTFSVSDSYPHDSDVRHPDAHTFVFILKSPVQKKHGLKKDQAIQPQQWFTSLNAANATKTITFKSPEKIEEVKSGDKVKESQSREMYQLFVFTFHGVNIEVARNAEISQRKREESDPETNETEADNPDVVTEVTTAQLHVLKDLLQLQRMRQLEKTAEPLPDMVVGTQVSTIKPVTAESLRSKIFRSRQDERYDRCLQLQVEFQNKILEEKTRRKTTVPRNSNHFTDSVETSQSPMSELEKRVNQLTTFFHEMAVHQPRDDELHGNAVEAAEAVEEEHLLKRFSAMFDHDADLQNVLDEEKWSTDPVKIARRRDSIYTNLPKTMLLETQEDTREDKWTFEDYENTAQYIEQLMLDVASHATQQQEKQSFEDEERKRAVMTQLVDSWQYTQHRVYEAATRRRINEMELKRRTQWLQSEYIQAKRGDKLERPVLILPKQRFLVQEHSLPSNAIWEVSKAPNNQSILSSGPAVGLGSPMRRLSPLTENALKPQRPSVRPATVSTVERPSNVTALRSAAISRARVRRIRSAHSTTRGESSFSTCRMQTTSEEVSPQREIPGCSIPIPNADTNVDDNDSSNDSGQTKSLQFSYGPAPLPLVLTSPTELDNRVDTNVKDTSMERSPVQGKRRRKRKKRSGRNPTDIHFRRRVLELVSISAKLKALDSEEWKDEQGIGSIDELSSVPCLPSR